MDVVREHATLVVSAILMIILQIVLAPAMTIFYAMPNFVLVFIVLEALTRNRSFGPILPFIMGLIYDFTMGGPIGSMAFCFVLVTIFAAYLFRSMDNGTLFMPFIFIGASSLCIEILYGILIVIFGVNVGIGEAILFRAIPCALYDCIIGILLYPLARRLFAETDPMQPGSPMLR